MNIPQQLTILLVLGSLFSCDGAGVADSKPIITDQFTMVYVDFSLSQDEKSLSTITDKVKQIFKGQSKKLNLQFMVRIIDKDYSFEPLFFHEQDAIKTKSKKKNKIYDDEMELAANSLADSLTKFYQNNRHKSHVFQQTCICNSLENVSRTVSSLNQETCKIRLVVISDMFEECSAKDSYFKEDFYMCEGDKTFEELRQEIDSLYQPDKLLSKYVLAEDLYFIQMKNQNHNNHSSCLNENEVQNLWNSLLVKLGYSQDEVDQDAIKYSDLIPGSLLNHE